MQRLIFTALLLIATCYEVAAVDLHVLERHNKLSLKIDTLSSRLNQLKSKIDNSYYSAFYKHAKKVFDTERALYKQYEGLEKNRLSSNQKLIATKLKKLQAFRRNATQLELLAQEVYALEKADADTLDQAVSTAKALVMGYDPNGAGVFGQASLLSGNCTPGPLSKKSNCNSTFLSRNIYVRDLTSVDDSVSYSYFQFDDEPIANVVSDEQGMFALDLEPGTYSIFIEDDGKEYCNSFNVDGVACLVEIKEDTKTDFNIVVDKAVW